MDGDSSEAPGVSPYSEQWVRDEGTSGFRIVIDPARQFVHVVLWGEWRNAKTDNLVVAHAKAVAAMKKAGARHGEFLTLVDMREKLMSMVKWWLSFNDRLLATPRH